MSRRWSVVLLLAAAAAGVLYWVTAPQMSVAGLPAAHTPDLANGQLMFWAGGCASCHAAPDSEDEQRLRLAGGLELPTPFGLFRVPNISPHPEAGIGKWTDVDFVRAMRFGVSPQGQHYYPAFPYDYYQHMTVTDLLDLYGFLQTLPAVAATAEPSEIGFPYSVRRGIGFWKALYLDGRDLTGAGDEILQRGEYLVRGPGHCGFCHTPRNALGGPISGRFLAGAPSLELSADGEPEGRIPNITPHADGIAAWTADDIAFSLEMGFDPDYDSFGGSMVEVQENMARLPAADRAAIGAYLKSVPAIPSSTEPR